MAEPHSVLAFFYNDTATTEIYTLSLHDAVPIFLRPLELGDGAGHVVQEGLHDPGALARRDRKSTRLNSSHDNISYGVFCLKKKKKKEKKRKKKKKKEKKGEKKKKKKKG